jgi:hypothetical protein
MSPVSTLPHFNHLVADALAAHSFVKLDDLIILDNSAKYTPDGIQKAQNTSSDALTLAAIFETMANLNQIALESINLCAGSYGPSFRDSLFAAAGNLSSLTKGRPVRLVELGPEPWKARAIISGLLAAGVTVQQYVGVDINPESEQTMRKALEPLIGPHRFSYLVRDFYEASVNDYPPLPVVNGFSATERGGTVTIMTNLGFQEGNDLPSRIGPMLARLTRPGDLLLSEMQVYHDEQEAHTAAIRDFYLHPEMRRFSMLVGSKFHDQSRIKSDVQKAAPSDYVYNLVPLDTEIGTVNVATTMVGVQVQGTKKYVLTNSCLKYTPDQFAMAREKTGSFLVRSTQTTGDESVVFQISERF